ncbi:MAG: phage tail protein [Bacteroidetes bacterium]|nr:phage tail protein [Bacteroidota bacterium]MBX7045742.1 tail fiber protein [Ignavibacteria bacterium]
MKFFTNKVSGNTENKSDKNNRRGFISKALKAVAGSALFLSAGKLFAKENKSDEKKSANGLRISAGQDPFIGEVVAFAFPNAPQGYLACNGQILSVASYQNLFALLGVTYGGNGVTTFALPDLRGRVPIGFGQGTGLTNYTLGMTAGTESETLALSHLPAHSHSFSANSDEGDSPDPSMGFPSKYSDGINAYGTSANATLNSGTIIAAGGGQSHSNMQPFLTVNYCIATEGIYPST